jgi:DNA polymerase-3 subunit gamma/tau
MAAAARESAARSAARHEIDEPSPDDPDITSSSLVGVPLVAQLLGGTVIDEQFDDPQG